MAEPKPIYAPIPARAMGDKTLTGEDLRVLMALAAHDRLGANGIGCYASHPRLAALVGCHIKSLSRSLSTLAGKQYITAGPHPLNGRLRVYRVIYSEFDGLYLKAGIGSNAVTNPASIGSNPVAENGPIGNKDFEKAVDYQEDTGVNILGETYNRSRETVLIHPVETASSTEAPWKQGMERVNSTSVGALLAMVERSFKAGAQITNLRKWHEWLDGLVGAEATLDNNDSNYGRAQRLFEEIGSVLDVGGAS
ncbi:MAG: helix-turn-helix domain-containing protein [Mesorhizobium sp.]|uniref:helix-turn-helix domain-containing protein n=1 Tax=Mesorhizobium sp. TaxID=1871066 RepID=UPI00122985E9|nr:helix-turn-helix domain-containing protein [Mesorhizobium sp.]TIP74851.1 MAG: helix-turn-helix domain-containing protein [Mesorhizobium sp.]TIQ14637.1 MAG: helix-turn-helix domain-containing protein [Mesorhizobium sp.]TIR52180.1 MAG: helix-turn-helix domain-containing protein [Mesorhizobium sp.]TJV96264.1 MAG: helix-turn-helix domain-containing protein [Mesorhizobium sp.]